MEKINVFEIMKEHNQEQIAFYSDKSVKLRAILAIHNTTLGPAIGGIRIYRYSSVNEALLDLCRLSRAMTYKTAAAGVNFGGGEIIVVDQPGMERGEALFRALGRFIESFKGRIIAGGDVGMTEDFMEHIRVETSYITGLPAYYGGSGKPSHNCAYGTLLGIQACAKYRWGSNKLHDKTVLVQGYGRTGSALCRLLTEQKAKVMVADIDGKAARQAKGDGYEVVSHQEVYNTPCDIFAPCAIGPVIHRDTARQLKCAIVAGTANNQLLQEDDDQLLKKRNILYAPDFIINAGALIDVAEEYGDYNPDKVAHQTEQIYDRLLFIFRQAEKKRQSVNQTAVEYALKRIETIKSVKGIFHRKDNIR